MAEGKKKEKKILDSIFSAFSFNAQCCGTRSDSQQLDEQFEPYNHGD
jgi:hypothetical protein